MFDCQSAHYTASLPFNTPSTFGQNPNDTIQLRKKYKK